MSLNEVLQTIPPSASLNLMAKVRDLKEKGEDIIGLAGGEPDFDTPDKIRFRGMQSIAEGNTHYAVGIGVLPLRERIAQKLREENGIECEASQIVVTPGGKYAIYLAVRALINSGEKVMILNPAWVSYAPIVQAAGGIPVHVTLKYEENYIITEELLENAYVEGTKLLILNYPNNPTGKILSESEADAIEAFVKRHSLYVISDEVYERIVYDGKKTISVGSRKEIADRVITVNGFSKSVAMTGWRLGYLCAPKDTMKPVSILHSHTVTGVCTLIQDAGIVALDCTDEIEAMRKVYEERRNTFIGALNRIPGVTAEYPEGAFYAWVKMEMDGMDSFQMAEYLLEKAGVVGVPGASYGSGGENCLRFSFANSMDELMEAVKRIDGAMR